MTRKEASELMWLLLRSKLKEQGKFKTMAEKYHDKFMEALDLKVEDSNDS